MVMPAVPVPQAWPRPPFTVDTLFELPDTGLRYEVLEGALVIVPRTRVAFRQISCTP